ncbi:MAG TPA: hypothetical protein VFA66_07235 [Gaiellaceae bacterium]|nr:hypothetical protein [Gaiellaceae bacterium]
MSRRRMLFLLVPVLAAGAVGAGIAVAETSGTNNKTFEYAIGLWGDFPYSDTQAQTGVPNLVADMNSQDIAFSVHDGDLKAGRGIPGSATPTTCQSATLPSIYSQAKGYFNSLQKPAIFTPGDNDWTDCDRVENGGFNDVERLTYERGYFFSTDQSLGQKTMTLEVQSSQTCLGWNYQTSSTQPAACSENRRWTFHKVTYATLNVQGTCNNRCSSGTGDPAGDEAEYQARNAADLQWLKDTFKEARDQGSAGVMIIWQADPGFDGSAFQGAPTRDPKTLHETDGKPDGFYDILTELRNQTIGFRKPVVLVHGDSHYFLVDKPLVDDQGRQVENFTRVETFGDNVFSAHPEWDDNHVHWVKALVDPSSRDVFAFQAQIVPANRVAVPSP